MTTQLLKKLHQKPDDSWKEFLNGDIQNELKTIAQKISGADFSPDITRVLHFLTIPLPKVKVIILGQDPYPGAGAATGRAFEVGTLKTWDQPFRQVSLKNIVRQIYHTYYHEIEPYKSIVAWNQDNCKILPPDKLFKSWEEQGVLLLNTALTCETGKSGSHSTLWKSFTQELLRYINVHQPDATWLLWGGHAQKITFDLDLQNSFTSNHPMMCSAKNDKDFLYGKINTLEATNTLIDWRGK